MIHAKQLMVGDWVYYTPTKKTKTPVRIGKIYVNEERSINEVNFYGNLGNDSILEICFDPIPLTPEILEKNGFSRNGLDLALFDTKGGDDFVGAANLQYVHELQHALRLCGIEKEIVLP